MADCITALLAQARAARDRARALGCYDKTDPRDAEPAPYPWYGPWCPDYGRRRHDPQSPAWKALLEQVGMRVDEHGRYFVTRPAACGHAAHERNVGRDQLGCDGCRRER